MGVVCLIDIICDFFIPNIPTWYHRQLLILDDFIRQIYETNELWDEKLYNLAFQSVYKRSIDEELGRSS